MSDLLNDCMTVLRAAGFDLVAADNIPEDRPLTTGRVKVWGIEQAERELVDNRHTRNGLTARNFAHKRAVLASDFSGLRYDAHIIGKEIAMVVHTSRVLNKVCITRGWTERVYSPTAASWARLERLNGQ